MQGRKYSKLDKPTSPLYDPCQEVLNLLGKYCTYFHANAFTMQTLIVESPEPSIS